MHIPGDHGKFLDKLLPHVQRDPRFVALAAGGSLLSGEADIYSDLDLVIVVDPEHYASVIADSIGIIDSWGHQPLAAFTGEHVGEPRLVICLYDDPVLHVDYKFVPPDQLAIRIEDPLVLWERDSTISEVINNSNSNHPGPDIEWIEERFWVWIHYAATKLGRGEIFEFIDFLSFLRSEVLGPLALTAAGHLPRGVRRLEMYIPDTAEVLRKTVPGYDRAECIEALRACIELYRSLRDKFPTTASARREDAEYTSINYFERVASGAIR
jgi:predicted nucleotidyltransferase